MHLLYVHIYISNISIIFHQNQCVIRAVKLSISVQQNKYKKMKNENIHLETWRYYD